MSADTELPDDPHGCTRGFPVRQDPVQLLLELDHAPLDLLELHDPAHAHHAIAPAVHVAFPSGTHYFAAPFPIVPGDRLTYRAVTFRATFAWPADARRHDSCYCALATQSDPAHDVAATPLAANPA